MNETFEGNHPKLHDIGYFRVTSRGIESYIDIIDLDLNQIPKNGKVVDIGSGVYQELAKDVKELRPDITVFSVDPSLAIPTDENEFIESGLRYELPNEEGKLIKPPESLRRQRREQADANSIAAIAPDLPFQDNSVDVVLDNHAAFMYLDEDDNNYHERYVTEILRILKPGGVGYVYPIDLYSKMFLYDDETLADSKQRANRIIEIFKNKSVKLEYYEALDSVGRDKTTGEVKKVKRAGLKITKVQ